jgi:thiamine pyrophosphate-dependent acetolactate synthase large subunit-like protein
MMTDTIECVERLQAVVDKLATQGVDTVFIMVALAEVAVMTARRDPDHAVVHLEGAAAALSSAAQGLRGSKSAASTGTAGKP